MELRLVSRIPPSVNHYLSYRAIVKNGRAIGMSYVTQDAVRYKKEFTEYVISETISQGWERIENKNQHYYVDAVFYFDRSDMDCNNYFKCMLDAITDSQMIWEDDNVVCERVQRIYYDSKNPRVELTIYPVEYTGVFDNASQLQEFESSNCIDCTRRNRSCSVMKKALSGKIQEEISDNRICSKKKKQK